ncbi:hypothetical protein [Corynebacterium mayonis]
MWGLPGNEAWVKHSAVLNLKNVAFFVGASMGVPGKIDGGAGLS